VQTWQVSDDRVAATLAAGLWARLARLGHDVWVTSAGLDDGVTAPMPPVGFSGTLIVAGVMAASDLVTLERWVQRPGCSAVALGTPFDEQLWPRLEGGDGSGLAVVGVEPVVGERLRRQCAPWFDATIAADRRAAVDAVAEAITTGRQAPAEDATPCERVVGLLPEGVPEGFAVLHAGASRSTMEWLERGGRLVRTDGRWRRSRPALLERDPLHAEVVGLLEPADPRRKLHLALAGGDPEPLLHHLNELLDRLRTANVRALLDPVRPGALGSAVARVHAEACLLELDVAAAGRALAADGSVDGSPWQAAVSWAGDPGSAADPSAATEAPRAWLGAAMAVLASGDSPVEPVLEAVTEHLVGAPHGCAQVLLGVAAAGSGATADAQRLLAAVHRSEGHGDDVEDDPQRAAARLARLERLCRHAPPGVAAAISLRTSRAWLRVGHVEGAARSASRARDLFERAGLPRGSVAAELVVADLDLDRLRLARGQARLERLSEQIGHGWAPPASLRWRAALLTTGEVPAADAASDPVAGGARALLEGHLDAARELLGRAGESRSGTSTAVAWRALVEAVAGLASAEPRDDGDGWGLTLAAQVAWRASRQPVAQVRSAVASAGAGTVRAAFAVALLERVAGPQEWLAPQHRVRMVRQLELAGLHPWARVLSAAGSRSQGALRTVCAAIDSGGLEQLSEGQLAPLLTAVGIDGVEVVQRPSGARAWRVGSGDPCEGTAIGQIEVRPLGAEVSGGPLWELLVRLCWLLIPVEAVPPEVDATGFIGVSKAAVEVRRQIARLAPLGLTVLITGESGTGKEVVARALHELSGRVGQCNAVNMAAVPGSLFEAEVFGTVRGAYTGADRREGLAVSSRNGTLFLDEIGELAGASQAALLRFLDTREVRAVGSDRTQKVDVRLLAATNRDLEREVAADRFREDLLYRVSAATIHIPPLRERRDDVLPLRDAFQARAVAEEGLRPARWSDEAEAALRGAAWPGNARQLGKVVHRALVAAEGGVVRARDLGLTVDAPPKVVPLEEAVAAARRKAIEAALARSGGNRSAAARLLGLSRQTLLYHMSKLGIS
jgi:transcriptional regulator with AAA-type ATPase domain